MRRLLKPFLMLGSLFYGLALKVVVLAYQKGLLPSHRLSALVVSVGNLTWGGTGKTPMVIRLAHAFTQRGRRVAVLTRGYGEDEVALLKERVSPVLVFVGADRVASGQRAIREAGADLLLLDDGYQQWRLQKDLEILMVDATAPFGNGHLIPWGSLRESPQAAKRADLIVVSRADLAPDGLGRLKRRLRDINSDAPIFTASLKPVKLTSWPSGEELPLQGLKGKQVCTLAGIARPEQFEQTVEGLGATLAIRHRVMDHRPYTVRDLAGILDRCQRHGVRQVVTTAKDALRIPKLAADRNSDLSRKVRLFVLEVELEFEPNEAELLHRIDSLLAGQRP